MRNLLVLTALVLTACPAAEKAAVEATQPSGDAKSKGGGKKGKDTGDADAGASVAAGGGSATAYVVNVADESICYVYIGDGANNWSSDVLGNEILPAGYYLTVTGVSPGTVEVYAQGCDYSDWYGVVEGVETEVTFILYGGGGGDSGYTDEEGQGSLAESWLWTGAVEIVETAVDYWF